MGRKLKAGRCVAVARSRTVDEFRHHVAAATHDLGFQHFSGTVILDHAHEVSEFMSIHHAPGAGRAAFDDSVPQEWDPRGWIQGRCAPDAAREGWELPAKFGFRHGINMAAHLPLGRHYVFGVDGDLPLPRRRHAREQILEDFKTLMFHAQEAAFHILAPETRPAIEGQPLDAAEVEVLRWSMEGLPPAEIADIMMLSDAHVRHYLHNAVVKLGCVSKHQAVLLAIRQRLLA